MPPPPFPQGREIIRNVFDKVYTYKKNSEGKLVS